MDIQEYNTDALLKQISLLENRLYKLNFFYKELVSTWVPPKFQSTEESRLDLVYKNRFE